jgi:alkenylglycerophosphocholine hydrolase
VAARRALVVLAVVSAAVYLLVPSFDGTFVHVVVKPIPVLALAAVVRSVRGDGYGAALTSGLLLSSVGDVLLEIPGRFVFGLVAFLCAHIAYSIAFALDERRLRAERAIPFAIWLLAAFAYVRPGLGEMTVPAAAYMLAIGTMMWRAAARWGDHPGATAAVVGAILFGLSDTLIAIDRFRAPLPAAAFAIILLYWAGQAGIAASARRDEASYPSRDG